MSASNSARFVLLALAHPRSEWFRSLAQWCNGGALPAELVKCLSPEEAAFRLDAGRPASALIVDAGLPGLDRDLFHAAKQAGAAVIVIDDPRISKEWVELGAAAVLPAQLSRPFLLDALSQHAVQISRATDAPVAMEEPDLSPLHGNLIAVCGTGGTGVSTVAIALAQARGAGGRSSNGQGRNVVLADLKLHAEQAMLHDATTPTGGLQALVEAHRSGTLNGDRLAELLLAVPVRGYSLLTGLQRARFWPAIRPLAFSASLTTLTNRFDDVICDLDADVEREETGGSLEVEERTSMSRTVLARADVVVVVGQPSMKGLHSLNRLLIELADLGIDPRCMVPVFNQSARSPRTRAGYNASLAELVRWRDGAHPLVTPVHLPSREIDEALRTGLALPDALTLPLAAAADAVLSAGRPDTPDRPSRWQRIRPGSLGLTRWEEAS